MTENQTPAAKATNAKAVTTRRCNCGCGEATSSSKTQYKPGHDARHAGSVARDLAAFWINGGEGTKHSMLDELPSPKLQAKATAMAKRIVEQVAEKAAKAARKPATKKASTAADKKAAAKLDQTEGSKRAEAFIDGMQEAADTKLAEIVAAEEAAHAEASKPAEPMWEETYPVKIGRWTYPTRQSSTGTQERYTKTSLGVPGGEWIPYEG
jgi:hypothetical protein